MPSMSLALRLDPAAHWLSQTHTTHTHTSLPSFLFLSDYTEKPVCLHAEVEIYVWGRDGNRKKDLECIGETVNGAEGKYDLDKMQQ